MGISGTGLKLLHLARRLEGDDAKLCIEASNLIEKLFDDCDKTDDVLMDARAVINGELGDRYAALVARLDAAIL